MLSLPVHTPYILPAVYIHQNGPDDRPSKVTWRWISLSGLNLLIPFRRALHWQPRDNICYRQALWVWRKETPSMSSVETFWSAGYIFLGLRTQKCVTGIYDTMILKIILKHEHNGWIQQSQDDADERVEFLFTSGAEARPEIQVSA